MSPVYKALLSSYLSYDIIAWRQAAKTHANQLFLLPKRALRLMHFGHYTAHAIPYFLSSNILPLNMLYFKSVAILMHDITNNLAPQNISRLFNTTDQVHAYNTRSSPRGDYEIKFSKLDKQGKSFSRLGAKIWNYIPPSMRKL